MLIFTNINFIDAFYGVNFLKSPTKVLEKYFGPNTTTYQRVSFYQVVYTYLLGYCQAHPFVSFRRAEESLARELIADHR